MPPSFSPNFPRKTARSADRRPVRISVHHYAPAGRHYPGFRQSYPDRPGSSRIFSPSRQSFIRRFPRLPQSCPRFRKPLVRHARKPIPFTAGFEPYLFPTGMTEIPEKPPRKTEHAPLPLYPSRAKDMRNNNRLAYQYGKPAILRFLSMPDRLYPFIAGPFTHGKQSGNTRYRHATGLPVPPPPQKRHATLRKIRTDSSLNFIPVTC